MRDLRSNLNGLGSIYDNGLFLPSVMVLFVKNRWGSIPNCRPKQHRNRAFAGLDAERIPLVLSFVLIAEIAQKNSEWIP